MPATTSLRASARSALGIFAAALVTVLALSLGLDPHRPPLAEAEDARPEPGPRLYLLGATEGYIGVCGCDDSLEGGLNRVGGYLVQTYGALDGEGRSRYALIDAGNLLAREDDLAEVRSRTALEILAGLGLDAISPSAADGAFGAAFLATHGATLPWVGIGLAAPGSPLAAPAWRRVDVGGVAIGILGAGLGAGERPQEEVAQELVAAATAARAGGAQLLILLTDPPVARAEALAAAVGGVDLVVLSRGARTDVPMASPHGRIVAPGEKAHALGVIELDAAKPAITGVSWVPMGARYDPDRPAWIQDKIKEFRVASERLSVADAAERQRLANDGLPNPYVGSKACQACHGKHGEPYDVWVGQENHVKAFRIFSDLVPDEERVPKTPECVACHVVGFRKIETPGQSPRYVWYEDGVGCEVCHGPGAAHVANPSTMNIQRPSVETARETLCARCHVPDHSPKFDYLRYLRKTRHWDAARESALRAEGAVVPAGPPDPIPGVTPGYGPGALPGKKMHDPGGH